MSWLQVHDRLSNTALLYAAIMALWGLWRFFRRQEVDSNYWGALVIAETLFLVQAALGMYLWLSGSGHLARPAVHLLYGVVSILVVPGVFLYTRGEGKRRALLVYGVAFLFLIGILLRAIATGR